MKNCSSLVLAAVAGMGLSSFAFAQSMEAPKLTPSASGPMEVFPADSGIQARPFYLSRAEGAIFSNDGFADIARYLSGVGAGGTLWANDFSFTGTPWAGMMGRVATGFEWLYFNTGPNGQVMFTRVRFFKDNPMTEFAYTGGAGAGTPMVNPAAVPFYDQIWGIPAFNMNTGNFLFARPAGGITFPDGTDNFFAVFSTSSDDMGTVPLPHAAAQWGFCASPIATATNAAGPGTDEVRLARDQNANNVLDGNATIGGTSDVRQLVVTGQATGPSLSILYTVPAVRPTPTFDFGCLNNGVTARSSDTVANDGVVWYRVCLNSAATDDTSTNGTFLDAYSAGSPFDTVMAIYDSTGELVWANDDAAPDFTSMISAGVGRRAAVASGGDQRDGSAFFGAAKGLPAGSYDVAVAGFGASFGPGWAVSGTWTGGALTFAFDTNAGTTPAALAPSVAPVAAAGDDGMTVVAPGFDAIAAQLFAGVRWVTFNSCRTTSATDMLTLDFTHCDAGTAWQWSLFNAAGNQVNSGTGSPPPSVVYDGTNVLTSGNYYLGISYNFGVDYATLATTDGRWHMRDRATSNWNGGAQILVTWGDCGATCHGACTADFDDGTFTGTPDGGVTIDDLLYYLFLFEQGLVCADVDDGTFTGTLDGGVTIDDLLYYLFHFEGGC